MERRPSRKETSLATQSVTHESQTVNSMTPIADLGPRLRRDVALRRAGTLLGIAIRARQEQPGPMDASWCLETVRAVIEGFELETSGREPDAVVAAREADAGARARRYAEALEARLLQERSRARFIATERGHDLLPFRSLPLIADGNEGSMCQRCGRIVNIALGDEPVLSGSALSEGCLSVAEGSSR